MWFHRLPVEPNRGRTLQSPQLIAPVCNNLKRHGVGVDLAQSGGMAERLTRRTHTVGKSSRQLLTATILVALTLSAGAQTRIEPHSNGYSPQQDVQLGQQAAAEVRQQLPMVNDRRTEDFVESLGERLIAEIPDYLRQPAFRYSFDVVNLKDINAFALPGGPMFLHRGMIEAAKTDGEVAGVMAHELSHVILRHGTAQATKGQKFQIGAIAGQILGGIVGGRTGSVIAQGSNLGLGVYFLKYGRSTNARRTFSARRSWRTRDTTRGRWPICSARSNSSGGVRRRSG